MPKCALEPVAISSDAISQTILGVDDKGKSAAFDLISLIDGVTWDYKSDRSVEKSESPFGPELLKRTVQQRLLSTRRIILIGTASSEGNRKVEENRAMERAKYMAQLMSEIVTTDQELWLFNLGQNTAQCDPCSPAQTKHQRPVLIVGVLEAEDDVDLAKALKSALSQSNFLSLSDWSQPGDLVRYGTMRIMEPAGQRRL